MRLIVTYGVAWSVGLSVTIMNPAKRAEPIEIPSGVWTFIIIIIIIKNALIKVTLHTKVLQGHFTQLTRERCRGAEIKAA